MRERQKCQAGKGMRQAEAQGWKDGDLHLLCSLLCSLCSRIFLEPTAFPGKIPAPPKAPSRAGVCTFLLLGRGGGAGAGRGHGAGQVRVHVLGVGAAHGAAAGRGTGHGGDAAHAQGPAKNQQLTSHSRPSCISLHGWMLGSSAGSDTPRLCVLGCCWNEIPKVVGCRPRE